MSACGNANETFAGSLWDLLDEVKPFHAFDERYSRVEDISGWDECAQVLNRREKLEALRKGWVS